MTTPESDPATASPAGERRRVSRRSAIVGTFLALVVMAGIAWLAWSVTQAPPASTPGGRGPGGAGGPGSGAMRTPPPTVGVATARLADLPVYIEALGTVTPIATATVRPQVSGVLQEVLFREGEMVKKGQLLARIDPRPFEMQLMQATGQRMKDEAQLENARLTLERYRKLLALDSIARQEVDTQAALVKQLEATVMTSRAQEGTARLNVEYTRINAPITGRVGLRVVDIGNLVGSNDTEGIAVITQLAPIDVEFSLPQDQVPALRDRLRTGNPIPVQALDRSRATVLDTGTFAALDNLVDTQTGTVKAKARFANAKETLFPAQFVNVRMLVHTVAGAVVVPVNAVRHGSSGPYVYVLNPAERTVSLRLVKLGQSTSDSVQIASGLEAGEVVITEGADRLKDGASVTLPGDASAARGGAPAGGGAVRGPRQGNEGTTKGPGNGGKAREGNPGSRRPREGGQPVSSNESHWVLAYARATERLSRPREGGDPASFTRTSPGFRLCRNDREARHWAPAFAGPTTVA